MKAKEKTTFILNTGYKEQVDMMSNEQAGRLFRAILQYTNNHAIDPIEDPVVNMVFSFVRQQIDKDAQKYEETCKKRSESGKKGGRPRKQEEYDEKEPIGFSANQIKTKKADNEYECEYDSDSECDLDNKQQQRRQQHEVGDGRAQDKSATHIFRYGINQIPITYAELDKMRHLANNLFQQYHGKAATALDEELTVEAVYRPCYTANNEGYAAYDQDRAELLEFAFRQAAMNNQVKWGYIQSILDKYRKNGIETAAQAQDYEYRRNRGEVV